MTLGTSSKVRMCLYTMFSLAHQHGDILREGWKNILDCLVTLFKAKLLPDELVQVLRDVNFQFQNDLNPRS